MLAILPGFPAVPALVRMKHLADNVPLIDRMVSLSVEMTGETPALPSSRMPPGVDPEPFTVSLIAALPLLYFPNLEFPRIVKVAPMTVRVPLVTSRTVEFDPSPMVVLAVTMTLFSITAMSPEPAGLRPPQVARLDQSPDCFDVSTRRIGPRGRRTFSGGLIPLFCPRSRAWGALGDGFGGVPSKKEEPRDTKPGRRKTAHASVSPSELMNVGKPIRNRILLIGWYQRLPSAVRGLDNSLSAPLDEGAIGIVDPP